MLVDVFNEMMWEPVSEGIRLYRIITGGESTQNECIPEKKQSERHRFEMLFCLGGSITVKREKENDLEIGIDNILLLSDAFDFSSIIIHEPLNAYSLVIDVGSCDSFNKIYGALGCEDLETVDFQKLLNLRGGCILLKHGFWNQSVFIILHSMPISQQGRYCTMKAAELFYLLSTHQTFSEDMFRQLMMPYYLIETMHGIGNYIENHLDEKLTIPTISRQFNLSSTTLKNKFREFYGQPIHSWILLRRIRRAAELLKFTDMTILQIAQSVGYESTSQFNVAFRNTFGIAPSAYRKNVQNNKKMSDSVGNEKSAIV